MLRQFALLERGKVEPLGLAALLALDQRLADALDVGPPLLLAPDQIADRLAVIGIEPSADLIGDPRILMLCQGNRLAHARHRSPPYESYYWCAFVHRPS